MSPLQKSTLLALTLLASPAVALDSSRLAQLSAFTRVPRFVAYGSGSVTSQEIYRAAYPGVRFDDIFQAVLDVPVGDQNDNRAAVGAYVRTKSGGSGTLGKGNAVALFGSGVVASDKSSVWGINTIITDNEFRASFGGAGRVAVGAEIDFNIMSPDTQVIGISVGGNSLAQPKEANAFLVNNLGSNLKWKTGFWSLDGAAQQGIVLGASAASGVSVIGQPIWFQAFDNAGTKRTGVVRQDGRYITMADISADTWPGLKVQHGDVSLDAGHGLIVGGATVVGSRITGWTRGVGTPYRGMFDANRTQQVSRMYSQEQVQALQDQVLTLQQRVLALELALRSHGLIGR